ncbi:alpha/beta hydrolase [Amycolatopsis circi]|uniref:alpha/beta hydrolase n=1 Tax=Amycolatopsis circi TaxID=871959 RepID=UPI000E22AB44|nr:alpha/beta hydrolase [Amycolatopsis circi]
MRSEVAIRVEDGTTLSGFLHHAGDEPRPCIVLAHGFSGVKEQIDHYAAAFCEAGFTALVFDHRGFGSSEGTPRLEVDPYRQIADWRDVLTWAGALPQVDDAAGFGVWGSSYAGGLAAVVAADDSRVACVVSQIPNVSGHRNSRIMFTVTQRKELEKRLTADRAARLAGEPPAMIPVFSTDPAELSALPPAVHPRFIELSVEGAPNWKNEVTLRSLGHMMQFEPAGWFPFLAPKPWLMIVGHRDTCTFPELQLEAFESAAQPKKVVVHQGGHFQTYTAHFEETSAAARQWFAEHLRPSDDAARPRPGAAAGN